MDENGIAVSVVVPVYNSVEYLPQLLDGLLQESGVNFEVILVNDGSSDGSESLVDCYAKADPRVVLVHQSNAGQSSARNVGMDMARGEYVTFCDNDDCVLPGFVSENYACAKEHDADCVRYGCMYLTIDEGGSVVRKRIFCPHSNRVFDEGWIASYASEISYGMGTVWTGLYKRAVIEKHSIRFIEAFRNGFEDELFNDEFMVHAERYALNPTVYYVWKQRMSQSTSATVSQNGLDSVQILLEYEFEMFRLAGLLDRDSAFCVERLMSLVRGLLSRSTFRAERAYPSEKEIYERVREIILPYRELLEGLNNGFSTLVVSKCLLNRNYRLLYFGIGFYMRLQMIGSRVLLAPIANRGRGLLRKSTRFGSSAKTR